MRKLVYLILLAMPALASGGEESSGVLLWKAINTLILLGIIYHFGGKYIKRFFEGRRKSVADIVEEAQRAREESVKALEEAQRKLKEAKYKLQEGIKIAQETAKLERENALNQANEIAERMKNQAQENIKVEIRKAEARLKRYAAERALEVSKRMLLEQVNQNTTQKLVQNSLKKLEA
ncbi:MAG: ATP synthase F0 subunit B [Hydrogenothermaceae bacterium]|nr:ATP synthase F0 subunit B [Hydrogenothermaceae bacterium]